MWNYCTNLVKIDCLSGINQTIISGKFPTRFQICFYLKRVKYPIYVVSAWQVIIFLSDSGQVRTWKILANSFWKISPKYVAAFLLILFLQKIKILINYKSQKLLLLDKSTKSTKVAIYALNLDLMLSWDIFVEPFGKSTKIFLLISQNIDNKLFCFS